jgi:putative flippase GtrA
MEGKEFGGTRINRMVERFLTSFVYEALVTPVDEPESFQPKRALGHQLVKFIIVGGSSFVIDYCVRMTLMFAIPLGGGLLSDVAGASLQRSFPMLFGGFDAPGKAFYPIAAFFGAVFGIANSFVWNRRWTFEIRGREGRAEQLRRFVLISAIGAALNLLISTFLNHVLPGDDKSAARWATVNAALIVAFWNFAAQRLYAFRSKEKLRP